MSSPLDREGIFKAKPFQWDVQRAESGAVAVAIGFEIVARFDDDSEWEDWTKYSSMHCYGNWWVVKKDGTVNQGAVEQLAVALGWSGNLFEVSSSDAPDRIVQITVKEDTYHGKTRYQATWMNHEHFVPTRFGASEEEVSQLEARFGSLLRAAASGAAEAKPPVPNGTPPPNKRGDDGPPLLTDDDIPF